MPTLTRVAMLRTSDKDRRTCPPDRPKAGRFHTEHAETLTPAEIAFGKAMDTYKRTHRRPHPTWDEVWDVLASMGHGIDVHALFGAAMRLHLSQQRSQFPTCAEVLGVAVAMNGRLLAAAATA